MNERFSDINANINARIGDLRTQMNREHDNLYRKLDVHITEPTDSPDPASLTPIPFSFVFDGAIEIPFQPHRTGAVGNNAYRNESDLHPIIPSTPTSPSALSP